MSTNIILLPGDGYSPDTQADFIDFLTTHGFNCIQIPLIEFNPSVSYDDLKADNYCKYIDSKIDMKQQYWIFGISKGAHWARVYAAKRPGIIKKLISCEETTMNPKLLVEFEKARGNYFVEDYFADKTEHEEYDNDKKALDEVVSDNGRYFPKCPINIIWTSRNNENEVYEENVLAMKRRFVNYLKNNGCHVKVFNLNSEHNATTHRENFGYLLKFINA